MTPYKTVGSGTYGFVVTPGINACDACDLKEVSGVEQSGPSTRSKQVSKLFFDKSDALLERLHAALVHHIIDPCGYFTPNLINHGRIDVEKARGIVENAHMVGGKKRKPIRKEWLDEYDDSIPFITYGHGGETLADFFKRKQRVLCFEDLLPGFMNILKGLKNMHQTGYTHSDIKPLNMVTDQGDMRRKRKNTKMMLIDFGSLARHDNFKMELDSDTLDHCYPYYPPEFILLSFMQKGYCIDKHAFQQRINEQYNDDWIKPREIDELFMKYTSLVELMMRENKDYGAHDDVDRVSNTYDHFPILMKSGEKKNKNTEYPPYLDTFAFGISVRQIYHDAIESGRVRDISWCDKKVLPIFDAMCSPHLERRITIDQAIEAFEAFEEFEEFEA